MLGEFHAQITQQEVTDFLTQKLLDTCVVEALFALNSELCLERKVFYFLYLDRDFVQN
jgi:hypothetical protein